MITKTNGGGGFRKLLILFLILCFGLSYVVYRYDESPGQALHRVMNWIEMYPQPEPAPKSPVAPTATPAPVPVATPAATPVDTPTPLPISAATSTPVDPVGWLISNKSHWPRELVLLEAVEIPA